MLCSYCQCATEIFSSLVCCACNKAAHLDCLKTGRPSPIVGDIFFEFVCANCAEDNKESFRRLKLSWLTVLHLTIYNLHLRGGGKCGYFRWKEHICHYVDRHWNHFFGTEKKKAGNWYGTVAGTLSLNSPHVFVSGGEELAETGWWKLTENKPPTSDGANECHVEPRRGRCSNPEPETGMFEAEGSRNRRRTGSSLSAAIELKAKRQTISDGKSKRSSGKGSASMKQNHSANALEQKPDGRPQIKLDTELDPYHAAISDVFDDQSMRSLLGDSPESDSDLSIDPCALSPSTPHTSTDLSLDALLDPGFLQPISEVTVATDSGTQVTQEPVTYGYASEHLLDISKASIDTQILNVSQDTSQLSFTSRELDRSHDLDKTRDLEITRDLDHSQSSQYSDSETDSAASDTSAPTIKSAEPQRRRKRKRAAPEEPCADETEKKPEANLQPLSMYEERCLLRQLSSLPSLPAAARRLRRKLVVRQLKRERGRACFDLDATVNAALSRTCALYQRPFEQNPVNRARNMAMPQAPFNILDRFQGRTRHVQHSAGASFLSRLVGTGDSQLRPVHSPYTARNLKPFIRRDYESRPPKLQLLQQIQAYPHRNNPHWIAPPLPPIDYCYVQPQHIPAINALCSEFFWPAIDMSECLQYPDFSCVVLYRKCEIGFAFMVPDVKYNEAYITFIFTHPEWRRAGLARFMLYHLIQTCQGKDVTLHVSASNPAMLLYQQFGFKAEQLVLDFYDKYLPIDSTQCRHAFFLRLHR